MSKTGKKRVIKEEQDNKKRILIGIGIIAVIVIGLYISDFGKQEGVVKVNGKTIDQEYVDMVSGFALERGLKLSQSEAIDQTINHELIYQKAIESGFEMSDQQAETLLAIYLFESGTNLQDFKEKVKSEGGSYQRDIEFYKSSRVNAAYLESLITISGPGEISDQDAQEFFELNKERLNPNIESFESVKESIKELMYQEIQKEVVSRTIQQLRDEAEIEYLNE